MLWRDLSSSAQTESVDQSCVLATLQARGKQPTKGGARGSGSEGISQNPVMARQSHDEGRTAEASAAANVVAGLLDSLAEHWRVSGGWRTSLGLGALRL